MTFEEKKDGDSWSICKTNPSTFITRIYIHYIKVDIWKNKPLNIRLRLSCRLRYRYRPQTRFRWICYIIFTQELLKSNTRYMIMYYVSGVLKFTFYLNSIAFTFYTLTLIQKLLSLPFKLIMYKHVQNVYLISLYPLACQSEARSDLSPTFIPRHDVRTPPTTPPASPPLGAGTPDLSVQEDQPPVQVSYIQYNITRNTRGIRNIEI